MEKAQKLGTSELNKLQVKALRAILIGDPNADTLQKEYEMAPKTLMVMMKERMYDVGLGKDDEEERRPGNKRKNSQRLCYSNTALRHSTDKN
jgi:hypothetical protein